MPVIYIFDALSQVITVFFAQILHIVLYGVSHTAMWIPNLRMHLRFINQFENKRALGLIKSLLQLSVYTRLLFLRNSQQLKLAIIQPIILLRFLHVIVWIEWLALIMHKRNCRMLMLMIGHDGPACDAQTVIALLGVPNWRVLEDLHPQHMILEFVAQLVTLIIELDPRALILAWRRLQSHRVMRLLGLPNQAYL